MVENLGGKWMWQASKKDRDIKIHLSLTNVEFRELFHHFTFCLAIWGSRLPIDLSPIGSIRPCAQCPWRSETWLGFSSRSWTFWMAIFGILSMTRSDIKCGVFFAEFTGLNHEDVDFIRFHHHRREQNHQTTRGCIWIYIYISYTYIMMIYYVYITFIICRCILHIYINTYIYSIIYIQEW